MTAGEPSPDIEALIAEFQQSGMRELHIRTNSFELYLSNDADSAGIVRLNEGASASQPTARAKSVPHLPTPVPAASSPDVPDGATVVVAPYLGTFYRAPKPGAPNYIEVGDSVTPETEVCLVEVMKLFTAVRAESAGRIAAVLAPDGQMVEAGQPLFAIVTD